MIVSKYSLNRIYASLLVYHVPTGFAEPIVNYLVYGFSPGSFFTSLLANDAMGAISRSHTNNDILSMKYLVTWIQNELIEGTHYGSYKVVEDWIKLPSELKRNSLESRNLIYDEKTELMMILTDEPIKLSF